MATGQPHVSQLALRHTALRRGLPRRNSWGPTGSNALEPHTARSETSSNRPLLVRAAGRRNVLGGMVLKSLTRGGKVK